MIFFLKKKKIYIYIYIYNITFIVTKRLLRKHIWIKQYITKYNIMKNSTTYNPNDKLQISMNHNFYIKKT